MSDVVMDMWAIFRDLPDYPQFKYVMRRLIITKDGVKYDRRAAGVLDDHGLEKLRDTFRWNGLHRMDRDPNDDPSILETWL